jgi:hypothetical protein
MGIHPKIGITGLPQKRKIGSDGKGSIHASRRKSVVRELAARNSGTDETEIIGGICTEPILEDGSERLGYRVREHRHRRRRETIAHKSNRLKTARARIWP